MTINKKDDGLICLTMKESELDELHAAVGDKKHMQGWCTVIEQFNETYYRWRVMFSEYRFKVTIIKGNGQVSVLNDSATAKEYDRIESRIKRLQKRGVATDLRLICKPFKIVWPTFIKDSWRTTNVGESPIWWLVLYSSASAIELE